MCSTYLTGMCRTYRDLQCSECIMSHELIQAVIIWTHSKALSATVEVDERRLLCNLNVLHQQHHMLS